MVIRKGFLIRQLTYNKIGWLSQNLLPHKTYPEKRKGRYSDSYAYYFVVSILKQFYRYLLPSAAMKSRLNVFYRLRIVLRTVSKRESFRLQLFSVPLFAQHRLGGRLLRLSQFCSHQIQNHVN